MNALLFVNTLELGLLFSILSLGLFFSFKVLNTPDLTVDGSFTLGCAVSAMFCLHQQPLLGLCFGTLAGMTAGIFTGFLYTKCKLHPILSGILVMTGLYSINLKIMNNQPFVSLFNIQTIFSKIPSSFIVIVLLAIIVVLSLLIYLFLKTQLGMSLRATGDNEAMVKASSINPDRMKLLGFALANGLVALSGGLYAQYQSFSDISGGIGMLVIGLASIIIGEVLLPKKKLYLIILSVILGSIVYRFILTFVLMLGLSASDLKLFSAVIVVLAMALPTFIKQRKKGGNYVRVK